MPNESYGPNCRRIVDASLPSLSRIYPHLVDATSKVVPWGKVHYLNRELVAGRGGVECGTCLTRASVPRRVSQCQTQEQYFHDNHILFYSL